MESGASVLQGFPSDQDASGRSFGDAELEALRQVLASGTLTSTRGRQVSALEQAFARRLGLPDCVASASGTAAMHAAIAAFDFEPGDEIVTTPITDMGAIAPILAQGLIPAFADVDVATCNVTAGTIAAALSERTRAIVVTHLFGEPCDMQPILELAGRKGLPVIEDCSQAWLAADRGRLAGTMGTVGIFSLQQGKHITSGEGGLAATHDASLARRMRTYVNKAWDYADPDPDHRSLALNYRMTELQGAVALAQMPRLDGFVQARRERALQLSVALAGVEGITGPKPRDGADHAYWRFPLRLDPTRYPAGPLALARKLAAHGMPSSPRYIRKPAFDCEVFRRRKTFGSSQWPFTLARPGALNHGSDQYPGVYAALADIVVLPWNERISPAHVDALAQLIARCLAEMDREAN